MGSIICSSKTIAIQPANVSWMRPQLAKKEEMRQIYYYILGNDTKLVKVSQSFPSHKEAVCEGDSEELQIGHVDI